MSKKNITLTSEHEEAGWTALHFAVRFGDLEQVKNRLTNHPNDLNKQAKTGETPLHFAVKSNKVDAALALLEQGADHHIKDNSGYTPLLTAFVNIRSLQAKKALILTLIDKGAEVNLSMNKGLTPWDIAYEAKNHDLELLYTIAMAKKANLLSEQPKEDLDYFTLIHISAIQGDSKILESLQHKIDDINASIKTGETPLHLAAMFGNKLIAQQLICLGADHSEINDAGQTPAQLAAMHGHDEVAECLANSTSQEINDRINNDNEPEESNSEDSSTTNIDNNQFEQVELLSHNHDEWMNQ